MDQIDILNKFKTHLVLFLDELNEIIPDDGDLLTLTVFVNDQYPILDLINNFILYLYPHKDKVKSRDDKFFLNKKDLFTSIKPETLEKFKELWRSNHIASEDKTSIWNWADLLYRIGEEYVKCKKR